MIPREIVPVCGGRRPRWPPIRWKRSWWSITMSSMNHEKVTITFRLENFALLKRYYSLAMFFHLFLLLFITAIVTPWYFPASVVLRYHRNRKISVDFYSKLEVYVMINILWRRIFLTNNYYLCIVISLANKFYPFFLLLSFVFFFLYLCYSICVCFKEVQISFFFRHPFSFHIFFLLSYQGPFRLF